MGAGTAGCPQLLWRCRKNESCGSLDATQVQQLWLRLQTLLPFNKTYRTPIYMCRIMQRAHQHINHKFPCLHPTAPIPIPEMVCAMCKANLHLLNININLWLRCRWTYYPKHNTRISWYYWSRAGTAVASRWRLSAYRLHCSTSCCHNCAVSWPLRTPLGLPSQHTSVPNETAHCLSHIYYRANKWEAL